MVADSLEELAVGPPYLKGYLLIGGSAYSLVPEFRKRVYELGSAGGEVIVLVLPGHDEQSDPIYKRLRTAEKKAADHAASLQYRRELSDMGEIETAEVHLHLERTEGMAQRIGVFPDSFPCIAWVTTPDARPPILTPIKREWYRDDAARTRSLEVFARWLQRERPPVLPGGTISVRELRQWISRRTKALSRQIDHALGCTKPPRQKITRDRTEVVVLLEKQDEKTLRSDTPGRLKIIPKVKPRDEFISRTQLFYLSAFLFCGTKLQDNGKKWIAVDEQILVDRLLAWAKEGLRKFKPTEVEEPKHRIVKDWRRFVKEMHDRLHIDEWFEKKPFDDSGGKRSYRQSTETVHLRMNPSDKKWLHSMLVRLTTRP